MRIRHPALARYMVPSAFRRILVDSSGQQIHLQRSLSCLRSHLALLLNFWRLIFLERTLFQLAYICYDLIKATAILVAPSSLSWDVITQFITLVLAIMIQTQLSIRKMPILLVDLISISFVRNTFLPGIKVQAITIPALGSIRRSFLPCLHSIFPFIPELVQRSSISLVGFQQRNPTLSVLSGAWILALMFGLFIYNMRDPLQMRYARGLSFRAVKIAHRISGVDKPTTYLRWREDNSGQL